MRFSKVVFEDIRVGSLAYSPNGKMLVCGSFVKIIDKGEGSWGLGGAVVLLNPENLKVEQTLKETPARSI